MLRILSAPAADQRLVQDEQVDNGLARMKPVVYKDPRPAERFDRYHRRARRRGPDGVYRAIKLAIKRPIVLLFRVDISGLEHVPTSGPVIIAPNHASFADHFLAAISLPRSVQYMAKSQLFRWPWQWILLHAGVFPVRRGYRDHEAIVTAETILTEGRMLAMYCEGGRSRSGKLASAKRGIGRLALQTGSPIVPTAIYGSAQVRNWKRLQLPQITVRYGQPLYFTPIAQPTPAQEQAVADTTIAAIKQLLSDIATERGQPIDF
jgi:1-acyl-sn-glycerol-3-phosphate acyltransferase